MATSTKQVRHGAGGDAERLLERSTTQGAGKELKERVSEDVRREVDRAIESNKEALRRLAGH
jgi:hypothetical protein